jgi:DNA-binding MarR family transcriptional regulator
MMPRFGPAGVAFGCSLAMRAAMGPRHAQSPNSSVTERTTLAGVKPSLATPATAREAAEVVLDAVPFTMRMIRGHMREGREEGVSVPQFRALLYVARNPGTDLSSVAEHLGASMPAVSELVSRLVRDGLVIRELDPASRRRIRLTISAEGERQYTEARGRTLDWIAERLSAISPEELERLGAGLRDLRAAMGDGADF